MRSVSLLVILAIFLFPSSKSYALTITQDVDLYYEQLAGTRFACYYDETLEQGQFGKINSKSLLTATTWKAKKFKKIVKRLKRKRKNASTKKRRLKLKKRIKELKKFKKECETFDPLGCNASDSNIFYVDKNSFCGQCSDNNPGSAIAPWCTIQKAAETLKAGQTVFVRKGVYREQISVQNSGTANAPISFRTSVKHRAIISGAEIAANWQVEPSDSSVYYADLADLAELPHWMRRRSIKENKKLMEIARYPLEGWWLTEDATANTLVDTLHLPQFSQAADLIGAEAFYYNDYGNTDATRIITDYNPSTSTLTFDNTASHPSPGSDRYFLRNKLSLISGPGQWAVDVDRSIPRLYLRPSSGSINDHVYEYAARSVLFRLNGNSHITVQGFEFRDSATWGLQSNKESDGLKLKNCYFHDIPYQAVSVKGKDLVLENNVMERNGYGISVTSAENVLVRNNHIFNGYNDGLVIAWGVEDAVVENNFIHDHVLWGHPDNFQTHNGVTNIVFRNNVLLNGGQSMMLESTSGMELYNNLIVGSRAYSIIAGHNSTYPLRLSGNTIALTGFGPIATTEPNNLDNPVTNGFDYDYEFYNNIFFPGHRSGHSFGWTAPKAYSDYNIVGTDFFGRYESTWAGDFAEWQSISGLDQNSASVDPLFVNAPSYYAMTYYPHLSARNRMYLRSYEELFEIGDHIEFNFDRVDRVVTAKGSTSYPNGSGGYKDIYYLEFTPPFAKAFDVNLVVSNWKNKGVSELDFRIQRTAEGYPVDSPAVGMGANGGDVGYDVDLAALRRSDFDGDGIIDDPVYR